MLELLERLEGVRPRGTNRWIARCPGPIHTNGDRHPSLSVRLIEGDRWLLYCFAGCTPFEVCVALSVRLGDLFHDGRAHRDYQHGKDRNGNRVPRIRASEFLELASQETFVVALVAADMLAQKPIKADAWQRLTEAYRRLSNARVEVTGA